MTRRWLCACLVALAALASAPGRSSARDEPPPPLPSRLLVLGADGRPLSGAFLVRTVGRALGYLLFDPDAPIAARTDERGRIDDLGALDAGRYVVWSPGLSAALLPPGPRAASVRLIPAEGTDGRVRLPGERKAKRVEILALPADETADLGHRTRTNEQGAFRFIALHRGRWRLRIQRSGGGWQTLGMAEAGAALGERRVRGVTSVRGRLLDADGTHRQPVAGVVLRFEHADPGDVDEAARTVEATTQADGTYFADGLGEGVYRVRLGSPGWIFDQAPPRVEAQIGRARDLPTWFAHKLQSVSGRVVDADDKPLGGAAIHIVAAPVGDGPPGGYGPKPLPAVSAPDGTFLLQGVTPADGYRLVTTLTGKSPWVSNPFTVDRARPTRLKTFHMSRGWELRLRVRDPRGVPVAGAKVIATAAARPAAGDEPAWRSMVRHGTTDADGRCVLKDLPADDVVCRVRAEGWLEASAGASYPRVSNHRSVDVDLQPAAQLTGQVLVPEGGPAGPFVVRARRRDGRRSVEADTDEKGRFRFTGLDDTATDFDVRPADAKDAVLLAQVENVVPGVEEHLEILLPRLHVVRGVVSDVDPAGPPVEVVVEALRFAPERERHAWSALRRVALEGRDREVPFEVTGLPPGAYTVRAVQGALDSGAESVLLDRAEVGGISLRMPAGARVAGVVLDADAGPVLGARVVLQRLHGDDPTRIRKDGPLGRHTNDKGEYVFDDVAPGLWRLEAGDERTAPDVEILRVIDGEVLVARDLTLRSGARIEGLVETPDGRPLDGVNVFARRFDGGEAERAVRTDADGRYRVDHVRPGAYLLRVRTPGPGQASNVEALVEVAEEGTVRADFTAAEEGRIAGTVLRGGNAVPGALVDLVHQPGSSEGALRRYRTQTDASGRFEIEQLPAGSYRIQLQSGAWRTERGVELIEGDSLQLDLEAYEGRLRGKVVTREGDPVPGAHVVARTISADGDAASGSGFLGEGRTDPRGRFVLRGLPVGTYTLSVSAPGLPPGRLVGAEADLPGADYSVDVILGRGGDVDLRVVDASERGLTGARVWLEDTDGIPLNQRAYVTGAAGRLRIEGVPVGQVRLRVYARGKGRPSLRTINVVEGQATSAVLMLRPGGSLRLIVTGDGGDPLGLARIDVVRAGSGEVLASRRPLSPIRLEPPWGYVPRTGIVDIPDLEAGTYVARVSAGRTYETVEVPVTVETGARSIVRVNLLTIGGR